MAYKEDLGQVEGDKGDYYYPESVEIDEDTKMKIKFVKVNNSSETQNEFYTNSINIPMYIPYRETINGEEYIVWKTSENAPPLGGCQISLNELKGYVDVQTPVPNNIEDAKRNTLYIDSDMGDIYVLNKERDGWQRVHLNLLNYYTKSQIDAKLGCITNEQSHIMTLLTNGVEIPSNTAAPAGDNVINVLSSSQVDALKEEIMNTLSHYITEEEIELIYTDEDGTLRIDFSNVAEAMINSGDSNNG